MFAAVSCCLTALVVVAVVGQTSPENSDDGGLHRQAKGWNMLDGAKRTCSGPNGRPGVCMGQDECSGMNGKSVGRCFPFDACCAVTPNSCGGYSGASTTYFQNPDKFQEVCAYKINVRRNVCQLRIDFERFSLAQPTKPYNDSAYACEEDAFALFSNDNTKMNLPVLCGENSGQHVYVPVNQQSSSDLNNRQQVTLKFRLTTRDDDFTETEPYWKMKVTQLECPQTSANWWKFKDIARQMWDWEDEEKEAPRSKHSLAPDGCLQYFTDKEGSFESFNYNKGQGHYLGGLNYAVCFKRNQGTCGIKYSAVKFQLAYNQNLTGFTDRACDTVPKTSNPPLSNSVGPIPVAPAPVVAAPVAANPAENTGGESSESAETRIARRKKWPVHTSDAYGDYLLVPDGLYADRSYASKYCYTSLENFDDITVKTQGPLYVAFISDEHSSTKVDIEKGYRIDYSLVNTGC